MSTWKSNRAAFTLIELLVVVIIVAVLAAVGVPMLSANIERAMGSEAEAGLGAVRTALRTYFVENGSTYSGATLTESATTLDLNVNSGWNNGDLDGQYFDDGDYSFDGTPDASGFCVRAVAGAGNDYTPGATKAANAGIVRSIDETGRIFESNNCT